MNQLATRPMLEPQCRLPFLSFDSACFEPAHRYDAINQFSRDMYHFAPTDPGVGNGDHQLGPIWRLRAWSVDRISAAAFTNSRLSSTPIGRQATEDPEKLLIRMQIRGHVDAIGDEKSTRLKPGHIHALHAQHHLNVSDGGEVLAFRVPYDLLGCDPKTAPSVASYTSDMGLGLISAHATRSFFEALPSISLSEAQVATEVLAGLFKGLLARGEPSDLTYEALKSAQAPSMVRYVMENLRDPDLSARKVQAVFGVSRTTVYRAFEQYGGVTRFLLEERLKAAYRDFSRADAKRGLVRQVSERYCFPDSSCLSRAFLRYFGLRPGDVIEEKPAKVQSEADAANTNAPTNIQTSLAEFWHISQNAK